MKLKKVAAICAKQGAYYLFDEVEENGELIRQWLGDGRSAYPLSGLPVLDEENLCAMFDITEKRRKKCVLARKPMPDGMSVEDYAKGERALYDEWPTVEHNGYVVKPLSTNDDMLFIQNAYLSPLGVTERTAKRWGERALDRLGEALEEVSMPDEILGRASRARV